MEFPCSCGRLRVSLVLEVLGLDDPGRGIAEVRDEFEEILDELRREAHDHGATGLARFLVLEFDERNLAAARDRF